MYFSASLLVYLWLLNGRVIPVIFMPSLIQEKRPATRDNLPATRDILPATRDNLPATIRLSQAKNNFRFERTMADFILMLLNLPKFIRSLER